MFRYRLRTLMILLAVGPPLLSVVWLTRSEMPIAKPMWFIPAAGVSLIFAMIVGLLAAWTVDATDAIARRTIAIAIVVFAACKPLGPTEKQLRRLWH